MQELFAHLDLSATVPTSASSLFTSSRRREREPGTASESTSRETPPETPSPRSSSSQVSPLRSPPHPSSERSGVSNHGNSTASRAQRGRKPQTWHRRPSAQRQSRDSGALGQPHPKPRAAVEWFDKRGIVVPLRPRKHSNRHIYHGRVIARGLTYRGGGGSGRRHPIWRMENGERRGPARLVQRHRRSGDRGRCRLRARHHDARARLALSRRRGMQVRGRGNTTDKRESRPVCCPTDPACPRVSEADPNSHVNRQGAASSSSSHDACGDGSRRHSGRRCAPRPLWVGVALSTPSRPHGVRLFTSRPPHPPPATHHPPRRSLDQRTQRGRGARGDGCLKRAREQTSATYCTMATNSGGVERRRRSSSSLVRPSAPLPPSVGRQRVRPPVCHCTGAELLRYPQRDIARSLARWSGCDLDDGWPPIKVRCTPLWGVATMGSAVILLLHRGHHRARPCWRANPCPPVLDSTVLAGRREETRSIYPHEGARMRPFSKSSLPEKPAAPKTRAHRTTAPPQTQLARPALLVAARPPRSPSSTSRPAAYIALAI